MTHGRQAVIADRFCGCWIIDHNCGYLAMVKTILSVSHTGLRDWMYQRLSALYLGIFFIAFIIYLMFHSDLSFAEWHTLFSSNFIKVISILFLLALMVHAWIGTWTIFTDYVKCSILRSVLNVIVLFALSASFIWGILILWSV